jgi:hypothetical protein
MGSARSFDGHDALASSTGTDAGDRVDLVGYLACAQRRGVAGMNGDR